MTAKKQTQDKTFRFRNDLSGFHLSFGSAAVKIYPSTVLCWVNEDENMQLNN